MNGTLYSRGNFILDRLNPHELLALGSRIEIVQLESGQVLYAGGAETDLVFAYFPITAVTSMLAMLSDGSAVEAGTVGREGMVGAQCAFGSPRMFERWIAQISGTAARMSFVDFRELLQTSEPLRSTMQLYIQSYIAFLAQSIACNTRHPVVERCARWLLLTQDRAGRNSFYLTQEFLATMLGVRRPGVSVAAATLAGAGYVSYVRGAMTIKDRAGLESASCECYGLIRRESERLFGPSEGFGTGVPPLEG